MAQRRLAAIMFSDIVGYNSLLREDEKKAFDILRKNQLIHKRLFKNFKGRWLKEMESGILASFSSNIDAVICALSIQNATEELGTPIRIGIHLGDVIFEKKDVLGDGVNIASRIQNVINTSGIVISEKVYSDIKNKEGLEIESLGTHILKGVDSPITIFSLSCQDESLLDYTVDTGELVRPLSFRRSTIVFGILIIALLAYALYYFLPKNNNLPKEPEKSVLILPIENYLGSDSLDYKVEGLHDILIGTVGKVSALRVLSQTTANTYKNTKKTISEIAAERGVENVIKFSLQCIGDSVCFRMEIFGDEEGEQPKVREYHEETSQIYKLLNTITKEVSDEIDVNIRPQEEIMLAEYRTVDQDALDAYLRGRFYLDKISPESIPSAIEYFNIAIEIDPDWAAPYAGIAEVGLYQKQMGFGSQSDIIIMIYKNLNKALELDPNSVSSHYIKAMIAYTTEFEWEKSEEEFKKTLELNPSYVESRRFYAHLLTMLRRTDEALYQGKKAQGLDPENPFTLGLYTLVLLFNGECQEALIQGKKALSIDPDHFFLRFIEWGPLECLGEYEKAFELEKKWNYFVWEGLGVAELLERTFHESGWIAYQEELLRMDEEGLWLKDDGHMDTASMVDRYFILGNYDKVIDWDEERYKINNHDPNLPYISAKMYYDRMKDNPRYIALLKKMNLPVD